MALISARPRLMSTNIAPEHMPLTSDPQVTGATTPQGRGSDSRRHRRRSAGFHLTHLGGARWLAGLLACSRAARAGRSAALRRKRNAQRRAGGASRAAGGPAARQRR